MDFTTLQIGIEKNVARIALNRPEVRNAMNATMIKELTEAVDWLDCRDDIRVIEICGNGKSFCSGADINYMKDIASFGYEQNLEDAKRLSKLFQKIYFCNKPVITLVHKPKSSTALQLNMQVSQVRKLYSMLIAVSVQSVLWLLIMQSRLSASSSTKTLYATQL